MNLYILKELKINLHQLPIDENKPTISNLIFIYLSINIYLNSCLVASHNSFLLLNIRLPL
jgi:hypothetical protein